MPPFLIPAAFIFGGYVALRGIEAGIKAVHNFYYTPAPDAAEGTAAPVAATDATPAASPSEPSADAPAEAAPTSAANEENASAEAVAQEIQDLGRGLEELEAEFAAMKAAAAESKRAARHAEYARALEALDAWMSTQSLRSLVDAMRVFRVAHAGYATHAAEELQEHLSATYAQRALAYSGRVAAFLAEYEALITSMPAVITTSQRDVLLAQLAQVVEVAEVDRDLSLLYIPARELEERVRARAVEAPPRAACTGLHDSYVDATSSAYQYAATAGARMSATQRRHAEELLESLDAAERAYCAQEDHDETVLVNGAEARRLITKRISKARKG